MISPVLRRLVWLVLAVSLMTGCGTPRRSASPYVPYATTSWPATPPSVVPAAAVAPLGWSAIERRVLYGVRRGVASFRFGVADRDDAVAAAMERAWRAFSTTAPIHDPEAWGKTIAVRVSLDALRRQRRDRVCLTASSTSPGEGYTADEASPLDEAVASQRRALLQARIQGWPPSERRLAQLLLDGHAETITAAAWLYREREEARGEPGTMYPQKARTLLSARRRELEDLA